MKKAYKINIKIIAKYKEKAFLFSKEKIKTIEYEDEYIFICYKDDLQRLLIDRIAKDVSVDVFRFLDVAPKNIVDIDYTILEKYERDITLKEILENYTLEELKKEPEIFSFPVDKVIDI